MTRIIIEVEDGIISGVYGSTGETINISVLDHDGKNDDREEVFDLKSRLEKEIDSDEVEPQIVEGIDYLKEKENPDVSHTKESLNERLTMPGDPGMCRGADGQVCCPDENCPDTCLQNRMKKLWKYENIDVDPECLRRSLYKLNG